MRKTDFLRRPWTYCPVESRWFIPAVQQAAKLFLGPEYPALKPICDRLFDPEHPYWDKDGDWFEEYESPESVAVFTLRDFAMDAVEDESTPAELRHRLHCVLLRAEKFFCPWTR